MIGPRAALLPCGTRLHLQHGPIDLVIGAEGDRTAAFRAARAACDGLLQTLVDELPELRQEMRADVPLPTGPVALRMDRAVRPFADAVFVTRMAAVAGSVADAVLAAMVAATPLSRAYVNNGGDIALHLAPGHEFSLAMVDHDGANLGRVRVRHDDPVRGIATSGRHGRSLSLGIADSVTVLAATAAAADVAATLIANAVDLPGHPGISRRAAHDIDDTSDLGHRAAVTGCTALSAAQKARALDAGRARAQDHAGRGLIHAAALFLQGTVETTAQHRFFQTQRTPSHA